MWAYLLVLLSLSAAANGSSQGDRQSVLQTVLDALNPRLSNTIEDSSIVLYCNNSGDVPDDRVPSPRPPPLSPLHDTFAIEDAILTELVAVLNASILDQCAKCITALHIQHLAAVTQPIETVTNLSIRLCETFSHLRAENPYAGDCQTDYGDPGGLGPWHAMALSMMSMAIGDMHAFCSSGPKTERSCEPL